MVKFALDFLRIHSNSQACTRIGRCLRRAIGLDFGDRLPVAGGQIRTLRQPLWSLRITSRRERLFTMQVPAIGRKIQDVGLVT